LHDEAAAISLFLFMDLTSSSKQKPLLGRCRQGFDPLDVLPITRS
jgi:hypothetical protein